MKVLAALDFGDSSLEALRQARALTHELGGSLATCHVLPPTHDLGALLPGFASSPPADTANQEALARDALIEHARAKIGLELSEVFIARGSAYAEIVQCAERWGADFIVVGSHGRAGLTRAILGSVAERVVRHAHCSVLIARPSPQSGVVLAATDFSDPSLPAIAAASAVAKRAEARLVAVSVVEWPGDAIVTPFVGMAGALPAIPPLEVQQRMRDATRSRLEGALDQVGATGEARVLEGSPASAIISCAADLDAQQVVVGTRGRTGFARLTLGSVAESVIRNVGCSVLAVRLRPSPASSG